MKKVFFISTPRAGKNLFDSYQLIYSCIEHLGHDHTSTFLKDVDATKFYKLTKQERAKYYQRMCNELLAADYCVFETTLHSLAIGQLIQFAIDNHKPLIALYKDNEPFFLDGAELEEKRVVVCHYKDDNIKKVLVDAFMYLEEELSTRFTMILPNSMLGYLQRRINNGGSVSEYIRGLIKKDMES